MVAVYLRQLRGNQDGMFSEFILVSHFHLVLQLRDQRFSDEISTWFPLRGNQMRKRSSQRMIASSTSTKTVNGKQDIPRSALSWCYSLEIKSPKYHFFNAVPSHPKPDVLLPPT